jgi:uncharacterized protein (DUF1810 family)
MDPFDLGRFVSAQDQGGTYAQALAELRHGRKVSHWMWFVFPQLAGLGRSSTARHYAISSPEEARAYLAHEVLGPRLLECSEVLTTLTGRTADGIFGPVDAVKLRSSMTLFDHVAPSDSIFATVLEMYFAGEQDAMTRRLIAEQTR